MINTINNLAKEFLQLTKPIRVISHYDTDGITSASIMIKALKRLDKKFSVRIVKGIDQEILNQELKRDEILFFTDLASNSLEQLKQAKNPVFILDHHEINPNEIVSNIKIINPHIFNEEEISGAGISYLFAKALSEQNKDLAKLALIGMIGDRIEHISKIFQQILNDVEGLTIKKGLLIFSATRPLKRSLEYSTAMLIPGVTGNSSGVYELLRETQISGERTLVDLTDEEMSRLITAIMIRKAAHNDKDKIIGNIYLLKLFNQVEDVRELSVLINACSRLGYADAAVAFCMEKEKAKEFAQNIYTEYKQELISALDNIERIEKISGKGFVIMNAKEKIKDTIIGTVTSMLSSSLNYEQGTVLIGMAYNEDKIKVSARIVGHGKNLKDILQRSVLNISAEVGGHENAAGCLISKEYEQQFLDSLKKNLEVEIIKI